MTNGSSPKRQGLRGSEPQERYVDAWYQGLSVEPRGEKTWLRASLMGNGQGLSVKGPIASLCFKLLHSFACGFSPTPSPRAAVGWQMFNNHSHRLRKAFILTGIRGTHQLCWFWMVGPVMVNWKTEAVTGGLGPGSQCASDCWWAGGSTRRAS